MTEAGRRSDKGCNNVYLGNGLGCDNTHFNISTKYSHAVLS